MGHSRSLICLFMVTVADKLDRNFLKNVINLFYLLTIIHHFATFCLEFFNVRVLMFFVCISLSHKQIIKTFFLQLLVAVVVVVVLVAVVGGVVVVPVTVAVYFSLKKEHFDNQVNCKTSKEKKIG